MDFGFTDDQVAVRDAVRAFCREHAALTTVADREGKASAAPAWEALARLGVLGMLGDAEGAGLGPIEAAVAFEELGASLCSGPVLWSTVGAPVVEGVATGSVRVTGMEVGAGSGPVVVPHAGESDVVLLLHPDRIAACPAGDLPAPVESSGLDPLTPTAAFPSLPAGRPVGDAAAAARLRLLGTILAAASLVGAARGALDVASAYALEREQFGVPIGSFQAIKHLLADMYVRLELARGAVYAAAAVAAGRGSGDAARAAGAAKLLAGEAGLANSRSAVQILGGMGFTWDMLPHYFLKRTWVLENSFGTAQRHALQLGDAVAADLRRERA